MQLRRGIQVACIGLALLIGLSFIGFHDGRYVYGPWLLGGLIPMFVDIAQIISAVLSGAQFGLVAARTPAASGRPSKAQPLRRRQAPDRRCRHRQDRTAAGARARRPRSKNRLDRRTASRVPRTTDRKRAAGKAGGSFDSWRE